MYCLAIRLEPSAQRNAQPKEIARFFHHGKHGELFIPCTEIAINVKVYPGNLQDLIALIHVLSLLLHRINL